MVMVLLLALELPLVGLALWVAVALLLPVLLPLVAVPAPVVAPAALVIMLDPPLWLAASPVASCVWLVSTAPVALAVADPLLAPLAPSTLSVLAAAVLSPIWPVAVAEPLPLVELPRVALVEVSARWTLVLPSPPDLAPAEVVFASWKLVSEAVSV